MTICSLRYTCEGCGRQAAGGGQRFCWSCLVDILFGRPPGTLAEQERAKCRAQRSEVEEAHLGERKGGASMVEIHNREGRVIHRSRNLRGILDHGRTVGIQSATGELLPHSRGRLLVHFGDGSTAEAQFASFTVLERWLHSRRSWSGCRRISDCEPF